MRRRAGDMGHAVRARAARRWSADRLARARQHQRAAAEHGAQEYLQAAVAANVVERAPDRGSARVAALIAAVRPERLCTTIFGRPVVPDVKSVPSVWQWVARRRRLHQRPADDANGDAERRMIERTSSSETITSTSAAAINAGRWLCSTSEGQSVIRRATPSSSIRARAVVELNAGYQQNRAARQLRQPSAYARSAAQIYERNAGIEPVEKKPVALAQSISKRFGSVCWHLRTLARTRAA